MAEIIKIMTKLVKYLNKNHIKSVRIFEISNIKSLIEDTASACVVYILYIHDVVNFRSVESILCCKL